MKYKQVSPQDLVAELALHRAVAERFSSASARIEALYDSTAYFWIPRLVIADGHSERNDASPRPFVGTRRRVSRLADAAGLGFASSIVIGIGSITDVAGESPGRALSTTVGADHVLEVCFATSDVEHDSDVLIAKALGLVTGAFDPRLGVQMRHSIASSTPLESPLPPYPATGREIVIVEARPTTPLKGAGEVGGDTSPHGPLTSRHRVRGHWRSQPYGPRSSLRRRIWIEPHWAGPADAPIQTRVEVVNPDAA